MKKLLNISDFYVPNNELVERGYLSNLTDFKTID
tara:strand:+ start:414 stop:515 length:102 start_codon:yes stop_codon:yes gene_type:complete